MLSVVGSSLVFVGFFTASKEGKTGLTVTADVYNPANTLVVDGGTCVEIGGGLYQYTLAAASVTTRGNYKAIFKTTDTDVDVKHVPDMWVTVGSLAVDEDGDGDFDNTLADLRWMLRARLHDLLTDNNADGNYVTRELDYCINLAYRECMVLSKCHKERKSAELSADIHTYDLAEVCETIEMRIGTDILTRVELGEPGVSLETWDSTPSGIPTHWMQLSGSFVRIYPTPSTAATQAIGTVAATPTAGGTGYAVADVLTIAGGTGGTVTVTSVSGGVVTGLSLTTSGYGYTTGTGKATTGGTGTGCTVNISALATLIAYGYGYADPMTNDTDTPDGVPDAQSISVILDRAEYHARRMRLTTSYNAEWAERMRQQSDAWIQSTRESVKG